VCTIINHIYLSRGTCTISMSRWRDAGCTNVHVDSRARGILGQVGQREDTGCDEDGVDVRVGVGVDAVVGVGVHAMVKVSI
jgi:hypothetical protein